MTRFKFWLTVNLFLHAAGIFGLHMAGKDARGLTAAYWLLLTIRLAVEIAEGRRK